MAHYTIVIPARYGSTRLAGKMLADIAGKPMIYRVCERALKAEAACIYLATDDERIAEAVNGLNVQVVMTHPEHPSGTVRIAELIAKTSITPETIIVNLQGDLPLVPPTLLNQVAKNLKDHPEADISTLAESFQSYEHLERSQHVKVVLNQAGYALYFSRSIIPWASKEFLLNNGVQYYLQHIGLYAYRAGYITELASRPATQLEQMESLEQLRALFYGDKIHVAHALESCPAGVDTLEDLENVRNIFKKNLSL